MFFVRFGSFIAWFCTILGSIRVILGFLVAYNSISNEQMREAAQHYLAASTTGEAINEGMYMMAFGVLTGVLVQIAKNTSRE
jgi:chromate transport protein ChrA